MWDQELQTTTNVLGGSALKITVVGVGQSLIISIIKTLPLAYGSVGSSRICLRNIDKSCFIGIFKVNTHHMKPNFTVHTALIHQKLHVSLSIVLFVACIMHKSDAFTRQVKHFDNFLMLLIWVRVGDLPSVLVKQVLEGADELQV